MAKGKILVVDDEDDVVEFISRNLVMENYEVLTAYDGLGALASASEDEPDLILLDIMMPIMNGYEVCVQIKKDPELQHIRIVLVSSAYSTSSVMQGREAGADGYLSKPFTPAELIAQVEKHLSASES
ncbi:response regulator transcription factor [Candidatus Hydrogenedentota bacterium]